MAHARAQLCGAGSRHSYPHRLTRVCAANPYPTGRESVSVGSTLGVPVPKCGAHSAKRASPKTRYPTWLRQPLPNAHSRAGTTEASPKHAQHQRANTQRTVIDIYTKATSPSLLSHLPPPCLFSNYIIPRTLGDQPKARGVVLYYLNLGLVANDLSLH